MPIIDIDKCSNCSTVLDAIVASKAARLAEPEPMTQELYDVIRTYVDNGHALHPSHAKSLLHAFEQLHNAADRELMSGGESLSDLLFDAAGNKLLEVRET